MGNLIKNKTVKTKVECFTRGESIEITKKDIDKLNQKIIKGIAENKDKRERCLEVAENSKHT